MLVDDVYVMYIQFGFPMYVMLCEFPIFMLFSLKLIHKKAKSPRWVNSLDAEICNIYKLSLK